MMNHASRRRKSRGQGVKKKKMLMKVTEVPTSVLIESTTLNMIALIPASYRSGHMTSLTPARLCRIVNRTVTMTSGLTWRMS